MHPQAARLGGEGRIGGGVVTLWAFSTTEEEDEDEGRRAERLSAMAAWEGVIVTDRLIEPNRF